MKDLRTNSDGHMGRTIGLLHLGILVLLVGGIGLASLNWGITHDAPVLFYLAYQMSEYDLVPYRELFDMNMPLTYLIYRAIGGLTRFSDFGIRCVDLGILGLISGLSARLVLPWGRFAAGHAALLFPLVYLSQGEWMSLQREYLALPFLLIAVLILSRRGEKSARLHLLAAGLAFGLASNIKPQLGIGLPFAALALLVLKRQAGLSAGRAFFESVSAGLFLMAGWLVPFLVTAGYLQASGAASGFQELWTHYIPLYGRITHDLILMSPGNYRRYFILEFLKLGGYWVPLVLAGITIAIAAHIRKRGGESDAKPGVLRILVGSQCIAYLIYPMFSGQFWDYHWLPFAFWVVLFVSQLGSDENLNFDRRVSLASVLLLLIFTVQTIRPDQGFRPLTLRRGSGKQQLAEHVGNYLGQRLEPGETVQPLDWVRAGVIHGMLEARARLATPFVYYFHFFHHVSDPYIQEQRARFVAELKQASPRFIVEGVPGPPYLRGPDTTDTFPELWDFIRTHYRMVKKGPRWLEITPRAVSYRVWERKGGRGESFDAAAGSDGFSPEPGSGSRTEREQGGTADNPGSP